MVAVAPPPHPFALLPADHPFTPDLGRLRAQVAAREPGKGPHTIHAELKALPEDGDGWRLDRFYWSCQSWQAPVPLPFRADTLAYRVGAGEATWHAFPHDPTLGNLGETFAALLAGWPAARVDVLRYVPLRRLTFRIVAGERAMLVGKLKRRSRFREADARLAAAARVVTASGASFRVARPTGVDVALGLTTQEALPGASLADLVNLTTARRLLYRLGAVLRELHGLEGAELPVGEATATRAGLASDLRWVTFMRPDLAGLMVRLGELLRRDPPAPEARPRLCHGDFVPSQILVDGASWAVIDFDLCHLGDPYQDLAVLLAALPYDVPALRAAPAEALRAAEAACVAGYADRAGVPLDRSRLRWHRVRAELYYLGLALKKDWLDQPAFERAVARLRSLTASLAEER